MADLFMPSRDSDVGISEPRTVGLEKPSEEIPKKKQLTSGFLMFVCVGILLRFGLVLYRFPQRKQPFGCWLEYATVTIVYNL